jgi:hypothetical protein
MTRAATRETGKHARRGGSTGKGAPPARRFKVYQVLPNGVPLFSGWVYTLSGCISTFYTGCTGCTLIITRKAEKVEKEEKALNVLPVLPHRVHPFSGWVYTLNNCVSILYIGCTGCTLIISRKVLKALREALGVYTVYTHNVHPFSGWVYTLNNCVSILYIGCTGCTLIITINSIKYKKRNMNRRAYTRERKIHSFVPCNFLRRFLAKWVYTPFNPFSHSAYGCTVIPCTPPADQCTPPRQSLYRPAFLFTLST